MKTKKQIIEEILGLLVRWAEHHRAISKQFDALQALVGGSVESPLPDAVWRLWADYTKAVSALVGDKEGWLSWYEQENAMGANAMVVQSWGGRRKKIKTIRQLAEVIAESRCS